MSIFDGLQNMTGNEGERKNGAAKPEGTFTFTFASLPERLDELKALPEATLDSPYKTAALTVCALCAYAAAPEIGKEMLNFLKGPETLSAYEQQFLRDRFSEGKTYVPFSYWKGAVPGNDYKPDVPFTVTIESNVYTYQSEGYATLWLTSGGADSKRQVKMRSKGDQWFLWEQFLLVDIRKPASADPWA